MVWGVHLPSASTHSLPRKWCTVLAAGTGHGLPRFADDFGLLEPPPLLPHPYLQARLDCDAELQHMQHMAETWRDAMSRDLEELRVALEQVGGQEGCGVRECFHLYMQQDGT